MARWSGNLGIEWLPCSHSMLKSPLDLNHPSISHENRLWQDNRRRVLLHSENAAVLWCQPTRTLLHRGIRGTERMRVGPAWVPGGSQGSVKVASRLAHGGKQVVASSERGGGEGCRKGSTGLVLLLSCVYAVILLLVSTGLLLFLAKWASLM